MATLKTTDQLLIKVYLRDTRQYRGMVMSGHKNFFEPVFSISGIIHTRWRYSLNVNDYWRDTNSDVIELTKYLAYRLALLKAHPIYDDERLLIDQLNTLMLSYWG